MDGLASLYKNNSAPLRKVKFVPARRSDKLPIPEGIDLILLSSAHQTGPDGENMPRTAQTSIRAAITEHAELSREEDIQRAWTAVRKVGAGLQNLGNTCFMNSVLQCLTHTAPLAQSLLGRKSWLSGDNGFSAFQMTREHVSKVLLGRASIVAPVTHFKTLRRISKSFRPGRQEDAHEYLIALLDAMHESLLAGLQPKPPRSIQETSLIFRIFAGKIRSQLKCTECGYESNTIDPFLDISLEITRACTVEKALQRFTAVEYLEGDNKYKCPKQKCMVRAAKRISIAHAPNVLVIQLKRFEYSMFGQKITKKVDFETSLDLQPYLSARRSPPVMYDLYGVLVHHGHSVHSGHYYCFVRAPNNLWHQMDDASVNQVSERVVLGQKAYILFYIKREPAAGGSPQPPASPDASQSSGKKRKWEPDSSSQRPSLGPNIGGLHSVDGTLQNGLAGAGRGGQAEGLPKRQRQKGALSLEKFQAGRSAEESSRKRVVLLFRPDAESSRSESSDQSDGLSQSLPGPTGREARLKRASQKSSPSSSENSQGHPPSVSRHPIASLLTSQHPFREPPGSREVQGDRSIASSSSQEGNEQETGLKPGSHQKSGSFHRDLKQPPPAIKLATKQLSRGAPLSGDADGKRKRSASLTALEATFPVEKSQRKVARTSTDPSQLRKLLGLADEKEVGPSGEKLWDDITPQNKKVTEELLRSSKPEKRAIDAYDLEYDRGKSKKVKGLGQADTWDASIGNVFTNAWHSKRESKSRGKRKRKTL